MKDRRGSALLLVLWLLVALGTVAAAGLAAARSGALATRNRVLLTRAAWARDACVAILQARHAAAVGPEGLGTPVRAVARVALGRGAWCDATLEDPAAKVHLQHTDSATLAHVLGSAALVGAVRAWQRAHGPLPDVAALTEVPGMDAATLARVTPLLTTRGAGPLNLNAAVPGVLAALDGLPAELASLVLRQRAAGTPVADLDALLVLASRPAQQQVLQDYSAWLARVRFAPTELVATVRGGVEGTALLATGTLTLLPAPGRLAVVRQEVE